MTKSSHAEGMPFSIINPLIGATSEETFQNAICVTHLLTRLFEERTAWKNFIEGTGNRIVHAPKPLLPEEERGLYLIRETLLSAAIAATEGVERY